MYADSLYKKIEKIALRGMERKHTKIIVEEGGIKTPKFKT